MLSHWICMDVNEIRNLPKQQFIEFALRVCFKGVDSGL